MQGGLCHLRAMPRSAYVVIAKIERGTFKIEPSVENSWVEYRERWKVSESSKKE